MANHKTYTVQVPRGVAPCQPDDFPKTVKDKDGKDRPFQRSRPGSLRITPGDLAVTEDELKHLRKHHKSLARRLRVVGERKEPPPKVESTLKASGGSEAAKATKAAQEAAKAKAEAEAGMPEAAKPEAPKARKPKR